MASDKKIVFITGANTGLGFEVVRALAKSSNAYEVIVGCRRPEAGQKAIELVNAETSSTTSTFAVVQVDLESDDSLEKAVSEITSKYGHLDILINNGGGNFDGEAASGKLTLRQALNKSWDVNVTGTHVLSTLAMPLLLKSKDPRLMFITSGTSSLTETESQEPPIFSRINGYMPAGWPKNQGINPLTGYRSSKAGLNMLMREWVRTLGNDGVKVFGISPGMLATGLAGVGAEKLKQMGALDPSVGGEFIRDVVEGKRDDHAGKVIRNKGEIQAW